MMRFVHSPCPLCGKNTTTQLELAENRPTIGLGYCEPEFGGCDKHFALEVILTISLAVTAARLPFASTRPVDALAEMEA